MMFSAAKGRGLIEAHVARPFATTLTKFSAAKGRGLIEAG